MFTVLEWAKVHLATSMLQLQNFKPVSSFTIRCYGMRRSKSNSDTRYATRQPAHTHFPTDYFWLSSINHPIRLRLVITQFLSQANAFVLQVTLNSFSISPKCYAFRPLNFLNTQTHPNWLLEWEQKSKRESILDCRMKCANAQSYTNHSMIRKLTPMKFTRPSCLFWLSSIDHFIRLLLIDFSHHLSLLKSKSCFFNVTEGFDANIVFLMTFLVPDHHFFHTDTGAPNWLYQSKSLLTAHYSTLWKFMFIAQEELGEILYFSSSRFFK